jgi:hypothetical protein
MKKRDKERRKRMSLQNQDLIRNNLNLVIENNKNEEEKEVTEEEDPLKFFQQQETKKKKEEEAKKYLLPISEEEDPLKYFDQENKAEEAQDPLKFLKNEQVEGQGENVLNLEKHDEQKLAEAIKNNQLPEEIVVKKKENDTKGPHSQKAKEQKMAKRMKTAVRLSLKGFYQGQERDLEEVLRRVQNSKNTGNAQEAIDNMKGKATTGNTLLGSEEQVDPAKNPQAPTTKKVDLKNFMQKK